MEKNGFDKILGVLEKGPASIEKIHRTFGRSLTTLYQDMRLLEESGLVTKDSTGNRNEKLYFQVKCKTSKEKIKLRESRRLLDLLRWWESDITDSEKEFDVILKEIKLYGKISSDHDYRVDHLIEANLTRLHMQAPNTQSFMAQRKGFPLITKELKKQMVSRDSLIQRYYDMIGDFNKVHQENVLRWVAETLYFADKRASDNKKNAKDEYLKWLENNSPKEFTN